MLPEQMARIGRRRVNAEIRRAVDLAHALGARVVGLGGYTTPYTHRGLDVTGRGPIITTGNTLTALMAVEALYAVARARRLQLRTRRMAVVGARGSVGGLCARLLAELQPRRLSLIGSPNSDSRPLHDLAAELSPAQIEVTTDLRALAECDLIVSATGAMRPVLDGAPIAPGTIICDVARPFDASPALRKRRDLTIIDGGLVALPDPTLRFGVGNLQGFPDGVQLACLSETILLALCGATTDCGVGDRIDLGTATMVRRLAQQHGFTLAAPSRDGQPLLLEQQAQEDAA
jgi:fatty aldehyde-generating acyl-ACP reductase